MAQLGPEVTDPDILAQFGLGENAPPPAPGPDLGAEVTDPEVLKQFGLEAPDELGLLSELSTSAERGFRSLQQLRNLYGMELGEDPQENIARIAELEQKKQSLPEPEAVAKFSQAETLKDAWSAFLEAPISVAGNIAVESLAQFAPGLPLAAGLGAAGGTALGPAGTAGGMALGVGATSFLIEYGSKIFDVMQEEGVDLTNPDQISAAFADREFMDRARDRAVRKGVPVAAFDAISGGVAGRLLLAAPKKLAWQLAAGAGEVGIQAGLGAGGEAAGQALEKGEVYAPADVLAEAVAELGPGVGEIIAGRVTQRGGREQPPPPPEEQPAPVPPPGQGPAQAAPESPQARRQPPPLREAPLTPEAAPEAPGAAAEAVSPAPETSPPAEIAAEAAAVAPAPTEAQKEAGNYKKGHIQVQGLDITIETPKGGIREGQTEKGEPWRVQMRAHYGYIKRTVGADEEQVDVYLGDDPASPTVFMVDQVDPDTGQFDEHKAILGVRTIDQAEEIYRAGFSDGRGGERMGAITEMSMPEFQGWLENGQLDRAVASQAGEPVTVVPEQQAPGAAIPAPSPGFEPVAAAPRARGRALPGDVERYPIASYIAAHGGMQDQTGELAAMDAGEWHKERKFRRKLVRDEGESPDYMRERMEQDGVIPRGWGVADLLNALHDELQRGGAPETAFAGRVPDTEETRYRMEQAGADLGLPDEAMAEMSDPQLDAAIAELRGLRQAEEEALDNEAKELFDDVDSWFPPARGKAVEASAGRAEGQAERARPVAGTETVAQRGRPAAAERAGEGEAGGAPRRRTPAAAQQEVPTWAQVVGELPKEPGTNLTVPGAIESVFEPFDKKSWKELTDAEKIEAYQHVRPKTETTEQGEQEVIPGAERESEKAVAERKLKRAEEEQRLIDLGKGQKTLLHRQEFTGEYIRESARIADQVERLASRIAPQANVRVVRKIFQVFSDAGFELTKAQQDELGAGKTTGMFIPAWQMIAVSLDANDPIHVIRHESIHALRQMGMFTDAEWRVLSKKSKSTWREEYRIENRYPDETEEIKTEEGVAEAFGHWHGGAKFAAGFRRIFQRINDFLTRLGNLLRGNGFHSVESIFKTVEAGEIGRRPIQPIEPEAFPARARAHLEEDEASSLKSDLSKVMNMPETVSFRQRLLATITHFWANKIEIGHEAIRGLFDAFHPVKQKEIEIRGGLQSAATSAWKAMQKAMNTDGQIAVMIGIKQPDGSILGGPLAYDAEQGEIVWRRDIKPLAEVFREVAGMGADALNAWKAWAIANRSHRLRAEGRERLVSDEFIDKYRNVDQKFLREDGTNPFQETFDEWSRFKDAMLDFAEQAGTIDPESRKIWSDSLYVPFYRLIDQATGEIKGPFKKRGFSGQSAGIKRLVGGEEILNDVIDNIVMNVTKLADSSTKNLAMGRAVELLTQDGSLTEIKGLDWRVAHVPLDNVRKVLKEMGIEFDDLSVKGKDQWLQLFAVSPPKDKNVVSWMDGGKRRYYTVKDPAMLAALTALHPETNTAILRSLGWVKRGFTHLVTHDPAFMAANAVRDTLHSWVIGHGDVKFGSGATRGFKDVLLGDEALINILAAGGGVGGFYSGASMRSEIESAAFQDTILSRGKRAWRAYEKLGFASEYANRMAKYRGVIERTGSQADATYEAMDLLNYSMRGGWGWVRGLTTIVPFMNARLQGLYRLGRGYKEDRRAFLMRGGILMGATLALWYLNKDDDRYKDLEEWDKDTYYHIYLDNFFPKEFLAQVGIDAKDWHLRLPKPFEIGAIFSTIPERIALLWEGTDTTKQTQDAALRMLLSTLDFNPMPQAFRPLAEEWADKSLFTGAPIVGSTLEGLRPEAQYRPSTTETARLLGEAVPDWAGPLGSPVRIQHMIRGYFGALGMYALAATDAMIGLAEPGATPEMRIDQYPVVQRFLRVDPPFGTKWIREFYDMKRDVDAVHQTINLYKRQGRADKAAELLKDQAEKLRYYKILSRIGKKLNKIDHRIQIIRESKTMSSKQKRETLDSLYKLKNQTVKTYAAIR